MDEWKIDPRTVQACITAIQQRDVRCEGSAITALEKLIEIDPADALTDEGMATLKLAEHFRPGIRIFAGWLIKQGWAKP